MTEPTPSLGKKHNEYNKIRNDIETFQITSDLDSSLRLDKIYPLGSIIFSAKPLGECFIELNGNSYNKNDYIAFSRLLEQFPLGDVIFLEGDFIRTTRIVGLEGCFERYRKGIGTEGRILPSTIINHSHLSSFETTEGIRAKGSGQIWYNNVIHDTAPFPLDPDTREEFLYTDVNGKSWYRTRPQTILWRAGVLAKYG